MMRQFDRSLDEGERELLEQHMNSCPDCRALFRDLQGVLRTLESAPPVEPPADLEKLVMNRIEALPVSPANGSDNLIKALYGSMSMAAAMLAFAATLGFNDTGILSFISTAAAGLNSFLEITWNFQIVYNLLTGIFSRMIFSVLSTIQAVYIIAGFTAVIVGIKKLVLTGPAFQKVKD